MSLEALRAQAEAEETTEVPAEEPDTQDEPETEEVEAETDEGSSDEEEGEEAETEEESDDFELELDGEPEPDQQKPSAEEALIYKLTREKGKKREYKDKVEELEAKLAELQGQVQGKPQAQPQAQQPQQEQYPPVPVLYEKGINTPEQYQEAYKKWVADTKAVDQRNAERDKSKFDYRKQLEDKTRKLAERAGKFATEHKIKSDRVADAFERATSEVDESLQLEGALVHLLDAVGDGSERVAYYIGTNEAAMAKVKQLLQEDPNGLRAISAMTRMAEKLRPNQRLKTSKAPDPDRPIKGDGSSASAKSLQDKYDKVKDPQEMLRLRKKARELGVKLT